MPLEQLVRRVVSGMVEGHRRNRTLLRALLLYSQTHRDPEFRRRADELSGDAASRIGALLLARRTEISHPNPPTAVRFVLLVVAHALNGLLLADHPPPQALSVPETRVGEELGRLVLSYLGVSSSAPQSGRRRKRA